MIKIFVQPFIFIMWESLAPQKKPFTDLYLKISFILIGLGGGAIGQTDRGRRSDRLACCQIVYKVRLVRPLVTCG